MSEIFLSPEIRSSRLTLFNIYLRSLTCLKTTNFLCFILAYFNQLLFNVDSRRKLSGQISFQKHEHETYYPSNNYLFYSEFRYKRSLHPVECQHGYRWLFILVISVVYSSTIQNVQYEITPKEGRPCPETDVQCLCDV